MEGEVGEVSELRDSEDRMPAQGPKGIKAAFTLVDEESSIRFKMVAPRQVSHHAVLAFHIEI